MQADVVLEPFRRESGPAIVAGTMLADAQSGDAIILCGKL